MKIARTQILPDEKINSIINIIRKVYVFFIVLGTLYLFSFLTALAMGVRTETQHKDGLQGLIYFLVNISIYSGLRGRKKWVIPLILIHSAFYFIVAIPNIVIPAESIGMFFRKIIVVVSLLFYAYQLHFFLRREVKSYFNTKGFVFF